MTKQASKATAGAEKVASAINGGKPVSTPKSADLDLTQWGANLARDYCKGLEKVDSTFRDKMVQTLKSAKPENIQQAIDGVQAYRASLADDVKKHEQYKISRLIRVLNAAKVDHAKTIAELEANGLYKSLNNLPRDPRGKKSTKEADKGDETGTIVEQVRKMDSKDALRTLTAAIEVCKAADAAKEGYIKFIGDAVGEAFRQAALEWHKMQQDKNHLKPVNQDKKPQAQPQVQAKAA